MSLRIASAAAAFILMAIVATPADAGSRRFTYIYETDVMEEGEAEYEQWITHKNRKKGTDTEYDKFEFRHEIEWGLGNGHQLAVYFDWKYQDGKSVSNDRIEFSDIALEYVYQVF